MMVDLSLHYDTASIDLDDDDIVDFSKSHAMSDSKEGLYDAKEAFRTEILKRLGFAPKVVVGDSKFHRFATSKRGRDDAGYYKYYDDEFPGGFYGDWRTGEKFNWSTREVSEMSPAERERFEQVKAVRERKDAEERAEAIAGAQKRWNDAAPAKADHPYLARKGIQAHGAREENGRLLVPININGALSSVQSIAADGTKKYHYGAPVAGGYFTIDAEGDKFVICEGFATGATIHEATGLPVLVAFTASNLEAIARLVRDNLNLPGASITIAADDDYGTELERGFNPGRRAAQKAAEAVGAIVAIPPFDRAIDGEGPTDWNDYAAMRGKNAVAGAFGMLSSCNGAGAAHKEHRHEAPRPLFRPLPLAAKYPVEALGNILAPAAHAIMDRVQCPDALAAQSVLAVASLAVQAFADVEIPATGHAKPVSLNLLSIASTGERKSAADGEALWSIRKHEKALREAFGAELKEYFKAKKAWDAAEKKALSAQKDDYSATKGRLDALGEAPAAPVLPMKTCPEPTYEGLCKALELGQPSMGIFSDEGGSFISGHGMTPDNRLRTMAGLSSLWDGTSIKRVRVGDGANIIAGKRLSVHLMTQPEAAARLLCDPVAQDQGFLSRILVAAPDSTAGTRFQREPDPESAEALKRYGARILYILERPAPLADDSQNELEPRVLPFNRDAAQAWRDFADHVERLLAPGEPFEPIRGFANKLPEHAARIAAVLTLVDDLHASFISRETFERAIVLAEFYAREALRLFGSGSASPELRRAEALRKWLMIWDEPLISSRAIVRLGPNSIRDTATANAAIEVLVKHGWLNPITGGATVEGKAVRQAWKIVKEEEQ